MYTLLGNNRPRKNIFDSCCGKERYDSDDAIVAALKAGTCFQIPNRDDDDVVESDDDALSLRNNIFLSTE